MSNNGSKTPLAVGEAASLIFSIVAFCNSDWVFGGVFALTFLLLIYADVRDEN